MNNCWKFCLFRDQGLNTLVVVQVPSLTTSHSCMVLWYIIVFNIFFFSIFFSSSIILRKYILRCCNSLFSLLLHWYVIFLDLFFSLFVIYFMYFFMNLYSPSYNCLINCWSFKYSTHSLQEDWMTIEILKTGGEN